ncbi:flagellar motor protein MotB [Rodentibacter rarus]|uniref:OmpA/MotB family protein n=1 Tax=Rodentibacter rarus TaxID=1908260 RepID=UPI000986B8BD|nr:OmpA family protein [Rodentibacter rarus]OOF41469.1 flagellar motor protein MotB [Rodentibacter rarus]
MKDKPNEWVSISDLMSGVMAVVMLLLVMSVLQKTYSEIKHKQMLEQAEVTQRKKVSQMLTELKSTINKQGASELIDFNMSEYRITLKENTFEKGSACLTPLAMTALENIKSKISEHLKNGENFNVFVEGHTDNLPVSIPVTDYQKFCTVYDDNFTLSSARAREARKVLISSLNDLEAKRVIVAGYGDSRPLADYPPSDPRNRRVEIQFIVRE